MRLLASATPSPRWERAGGEGVSPDYRDSRRGVEQARVVRRLRRGQTDAEIALWKLLRNRHLDGVKFRRQHEFGPYVLDFYCPAFRLAIEADGSQHGDPEALVEDEKRRAYLQKHAPTAVRRIPTQKTAATPWKTALTSFPAIH